MEPRSAESSERGAPDHVLERVERRVRKVQHLEPFRFSERGDGRFKCELEKPIQELQPEEIRHALEVLESLTNVLRAQLEESENA